ISVLDVFYCPKNFETVANLILKCANVDQLRSPVDFVHYLRYSIEFAQMLFSEKAIMNFLNEHQALACEYFSLKWQNVSQSQK
ncbi:hypothetical protein, partial [Lacticaseibacillus casei]